MPRCWLLLASLGAPKISTSDYAKFEAVMNELSAKAFSDYRGLVYETPGFNKFFCQITPISEIAGM